MGNKMIETVYLSNISTRNKMAIIKGDSTLYGTTGLIEGGMFSKHPPALLGIEKSGILDSKVKSYARKFYVPENSHGKPNRLKIDCIVKNGKIFNDVNLQPKDVDIVDVNPKVYLSDKSLGVNQLVMIADQVNKARGNFSLYFSQDKIDGTEEVVYDTLNRLSVYKNNYWRINLLTIRVKDLAYIVGRKQNERVVQFLSDIPNIALTISKEVKDSKFVDNLSRTRPNFNVLFLIRQNADVEFKNLIQIVNSCTAKIMVGESELIKLLGTKQKYIELVTGKSPSKPIIGLPYPLFYTLKPVESISSRRTGVEIIFSDEEIMALRTHVDRPTILLHNNSKKIGTRIMEGKSFRTLLLDDPLDLPYVMVAKLQELLVK